MVQVFAYQHRQRPSPYGYAACQSCPSYNSPLHLDSRFTLQKCELHLRSYHVPCLHVCCLQPHMAPMLCVTQRTSTQHENQATCSSPKADLRVLLLQHPAVSSELIDVESPVTLPTRLRIRVVPKEAPPALEAADGALTNQIHGFAKAQNIGHSKASVGAASQCHHDCHR